MYPHRSAGQDQAAISAAYHYPPPPPPPPPPSNQHPPPPALQPQNGAYYPPPPSGAPPPTTLPSLHDFNPGMVVHHSHPPHPPGYPPAYPPYGRGPPDPYGRPHSHGAYPYPQPHQPAPRQRTAIACRYCRRRKIRCSGFDQSEDGRCANCHRFSQECVFTPVSAQAQAFVPAHAVYGRGQHPPTQLYGAYGQPLPPPQPGQQDPYAASRPPAYTLPSPTVPYPPPPAQLPAPPPSAYDERNSAHSSRKRRAEEPHTPTIPPPIPAAAAAAMSRNPVDGHEFRYPDPTNMAVAVSPASSNASHQSTLAQPYYGNQPQPRRASPTLNSPYTGPDVARSSSSPSNHAQIAPSTTSYPPYPGEGPSQPRPSKLPPRADRPISPAASVPAQTGEAKSNSGATTRPGMSISSIVSGDGSSTGTRSSADDSMLKRLGGK